MKTRIKFWNILLILALAAYVVKNLLVGADADEGYGIMVGYRLAQGDRLFLEMWEPHQTSAIFTALFIKPFLMLTGGNTAFMTIYLRVIFFVIQGLITVLLYRSLHRCLPILSQKSALMLALVFFVTSPKSIFVPEYSNLHVWFFALMCICFLWYYCADSPRKGAGWLLVLAGLSLTGDVLSYPSMLLLFPVCIIFILQKGRTPEGEQRKCEDKQRVWKECLVFAAPCILSAVVFIVYLLSYMSLDQIAGVIPKILGDGSHKVTFLKKMGIWITDFAGIAGLLLASALITWAAVCIFTKVRKTREGREVFGMAAFFGIHMIYQVVYWLVGDYNAAQPHLIYVAIGAAGIYYYRKSVQKEKTGLYLILISIISYLGLMLVSNWEPRFLMVYLVMALIGGFLCWNQYCREKGIRTGDKLSQLLCQVLVLGNVFGYCFLMIGGEASHSTLFEVGGIHKSGLRAGIFTTYMNAYRYNTNAEVWAEAVTDGSTVLYIGPSQFFTMMGDCTIASPNTISTPTYDESLLAYWELNPERYPDTVVIETWFSEIRVVEEDSFIMRWLEEEFRASEVVDYPYIRVYRK